jgi:Mrp family chromosome partitioning ATPase/cell division septation protein DedD
MTSTTAGGASRFYRSGPEMAQDLGTVLLGVVPSSQESGIACESAPVYAEIAGLLAKPPGGTPVDICMIAGIPGDTERGVFALGLAQAIASSERRVLIIDADLGLTASAPSGPGFAELIRSAVPLDGLLRRTENPMIDILAPGVTPLSAVERCGVDELAGAFRALRSVADIVLLGAPALSRSGKASRFVAFSDAVLMVVPIEIYTKEVVRRTYLQLWGVEAPLAGVVSVEGMRREARAALEPERSDYPERAAPVEMGRVERRAEEPCEFSIPPEIESLGEEESHVGAREKEDAAAGMARQAPTLPPPDLQAWPPRRKERRTGRRALLVAAGGAILVAAGALVLPPLLREPAPPRAPAPRVEAPPAPDTSAAAVVSAPSAVDSAGLTLGAVAPESLVAQQVVESSLPVVRPVERPGPVEAAAESASAPSATPAEPGRRDATPAATGDRYFTIQAAAFRTLAKAEQARRELAPAGYEIEILPVELASKGLWHRVFLGRFASEEEARTAFEALRSRGILAQGSRILRDDRRAGEF